MHGTVCNVSCLSYERRICQLLETLLTSWRVWVTIRRAMTQTPRPSIGPKQRAISDYASQAISSDSPRNARFFSCACTAQKPRAYRRGTPTDTCVHAIPPCWSFFRIACACAIVLQSQMRHIVRACNCMLHAGPRQLHAGPRQLHARPRGRPRWASTSDHDSRCRARVPVRQPLGDGTLRGWLLAIVSTPSCIR